ncbi:MAG TPA: mechanosensitive ion channel [Candidatus Corynebacterium avicola]|uniref:Mechanosensitive ion channel n=1 Tax=Candidatus Corynebacterium avicola TaxID=2838527 RepID=A0A9D1RR53_9CORY|nr:mechanosensitive ion channel [Candidatus Corynebacterium avicola]
MDFSYFLFRVWEWVISHGLPLSALLIIGILIPRLGRQATRWISQRFEEDEEAGKASLALVGALVYILEIVAYFILIFVALSNMGISTIGAAVPATMVSAAVGFGAQNIIGDFLNGFFIISERHYGVGDIVTFDDTSNALMGTVVKLTLRTTQIRTFNGELVTVPNSKATVTINYSKQWATAVVQLELPLTGGESMTDLVDKVSTSAHDAVDAAGVADDIRGDINVLPGRSITPPTAAGLPWTVGMEVNVATSPALQWAVERAIRTNIINTFWDRYQAPGQAVTALEAAQALSGGPDSHAVAQPPSQEHGTGATPGSTDTAAMDSASDIQRLVDAATSGDPGTVHDEETDEAADAAEPTDSDDSTTDKTTVIPAATTDDGDAGAASGTGTDDGSKDHQNRVETAVLDGPYESNAKNALSLGGRFRPSTLGLFLALAVIGVLAALSTSPTDGSAGVLSPDRYRNSGATTSVTEETTAPTTDEDTVEEEPTDPADEGSDGTDGTDSSTDGATEQQDDTDTSSGTGSSGSSSSGGDTSGSDSDTDTSGGNSGSNSDSGTSSGNSGDSGSTGNSGGSDSSGDTGNTDDSASGAAGTDTDDEASATPQALTVS